LINVFLAYFKIAKLVKFCVRSSVRDAARMVVGLYLGTTFSGFAFAQMSNPDHLYTFYDWPIQVKGGGRPYCAKQSLLSTTNPHRQPQVSRICCRRASSSLPWKKHGGWPARIWFSDDLPAFQRDKRGMKGSESLDSVPSVVNVGNFVTRFKLHLATTTDQGAARPSPASGLPLLLT
jgi:hypothetical protein